MITLEKITPNPEEIINPGQSDIGVIIDCKDNESESKHFELEHYLLDLTIRNFIHVGFNNIVSFEDRDDIDLAVNTLEQQGCKKAILVHAGCVANKETKVIIPELEHITAYLEDDQVLRQYAVFDIDKYSYFQLRGKFLNNVKKEIRNFPTPELGLVYLYPSPDDISFWDSLVDGETPNFSKIMDDTYSAKYTLDYIEAYT